MLRLARVFLAFCALLPPAAPAAEAPADAVMPAGRYEIAVSGMLTTTCARAIAQEAAKLAEAASAQADFESETLTIAVRLNHELRASALQRALDRAARLVDLGTEYRIRSVRYLP